MGRRSRKRAIAPPSPEAAPDVAQDVASRRAAPRRRARAGEAPQPIWAPFPLVELAILLGLIFIAGGLVWGGGRGRTLLACGVGVICLAALELAVREHVTGFRSHSALLALVPTAAAIALLFGVAGAGRGLGLGVAAGVFVISFLALREVFRRRSGGLSFRA